MHTLQNFVIFAGNGRKLLTHSKIVLCGHDSQALDWSGGLPLFPTSRGSIK
jgi:hypothetical protein